jgi:hypothetical protein
MHRSGWGFGYIYHLLSSNLGGLGFVKQFHRLPSGALNLIARKRKHQEAGDKGGEGE